MIWQYRAGLFINFVMFPLEDLMRFVVIPVYQAQNSDSVAEDSKT